MIIEKPFDAGSNVAAVRTHIDGNRIDPLRRAADFELPGVVRADSRARRGGKEKDRQDVTHRWLGGGTRDVILFTPQRSTRLVSSPLSTQKEGTSILTTLRFTAAAALSLFAILPLRAQSPPTAGPERVVVGIYVMQIYDLDPAGNSFTATFWLWTRHRDGNIRPLDTIHIVGAKKVESEPTLTQVKDGQVWDQKFFRAVIRYAWELREYPFDEHNFVIRFEEGLYDSESVVYVPDRMQSGIDLAAMGSRWNVNSFDFATELRRSPTTYGDPTLTKAKSYSAHGVVTVYAERRQTIIFVKLLIGAYVALLLAMLSYRIKTEQPTLFSARLGLLVGSLFATVVNLRSTEAVLGRTDDFTLVDKIHITISVYILVAAFAALLSRRLSERERVTLSRKIDNLGLLVTAATIIAMNVIMISNAVISK